MTMMMMNDDDVTNGNFITSSTKVKCMAYD